jgi:hypothetical protein
MFPTRRACFGTIRGSNEEFRSREHTHLHRAIARRNRLRGAPIPRIPRPPAGRVARLVTQMISHFRFERSFEAAFVSWFKSPSTPSSGVPDDFASLIRESIADGDNDSASRCAAFCESDGGDVVCVTFRTFQGVNELVDHGPPGSYTDSVTPPRGPQVAQATRLQLAGERERP